MTAKSERVISIVDAARVIFRTRSPSDLQVHRIYEQMKTGALRVHAYAGPPLKWTTTEEALADFLATHRVEQAKTQRVLQDAARAPDLADEKPLVRPTNGAHETMLLLDVYHNIWRDYFRALLLRRRSEHRSAAFHRAVVAGQVALLLGIVSLLTLSARWAIVVVPPEHQAVVRWLESNTDDHAITEWFPTQSDAKSEGVIVRVAYRYVKGSHRWVHTDRTFRVVDEEATELGEEDF